jgi:SAM-dependent methyltransferase
VSLKKVMVTAMADGIDKSLLDGQQNHWESMLSDNVDMFGLEPSESAVAADSRFRSAFVDRVLELGAGQGRDSFFFVGEGFDVTVTDYSRAGLERIAERASDRGVSVSCVHHDVREPLPFSDGSFDACYSHMLFCMALTTPQIESLMTEVRRVLKTGGLLTYTARTFEDAHYGAGIDRGDDMFEHGGFIVHFFGPELIEQLSEGFEIVEQFNFEEAGLPRHLVSVTMRKT